MLPSEALKWAIETIVAMPLLTLLLAGCICLFCFPRLRRAVFAAFRLAVLLLALTIVVYLLLCQRLGQIDKLRDGQNVVLVGRVDSVHAAEDGQIGFQLADPSGRVMVLTRPERAPTKGWLVLVRGRKQTIVDWHGGEHILVVSEMVFPRAISTPHPPPAVSRTAPCVPDRWPRTANGPDVPAVL